MFWAARFFYGNWNWIVWLMYVHYPLFCACQLSLIFPVKCWPEKGQRTNMFRPRKSFWVGPCFFYLFLCRGLWQYGCYNICRKQCHDIFLSIRQCRNLNGNDTMEWFLISKNGFTRKHSTKQNPPLPVDFSHKLPDKLNAHMLKAIQMAWTKNTRNSWKRFQLALDCNY